MKLFFIFLFTIFCIITSNAKAEEVANLGNIKITKKEAEFASTNAKLGNFQTLPIETKKAIITRLINDKLIEGQAVKEGLDKTLEFEFTKRSLLVLKYVNQNSKDVEGQALAIYQTSKKELEGKKSYTFSHILVQDEETAKKLKAQILDAKKYWKEKFKELAKTNSIDNLSAKNNGSVGKIPETALPKDLTTPLSNMKENLLYGPIQTTFGFHLIVLEGKEDLQIPPFEAVKQQFISQVIMQKTNDIATEIAKDKKINFSKNL